MNISQKIKDIRKSKGLTQRDLAKIMNTGQPNINYLESRNKELTINQVESIAAALDVSVKELLFDEKEEQKEDSSQRITDLEKEIVYLKTINSLLIDNTLFMKKEKAKSMLIRTRKTFEKSIKATQAKYAKNVKKIGLTMGFGDIEMFFNDNEFDENSFSKKYFQTPNFKDFLLKEKELEENCFKEEEELSKENDRVIKSINESAKEYLP